MLANMEEGPILTEVQQKKLSMITSKIPCQVSFGFCTQ